LESCVVEMNSGAVTDMTISKCDKIVTSESVFASIIAGLNLLFCFAVSSNQSRLSLSLTYAALKQGAGNHGARLMLR
jgi:hypothetical protein